MRVIAKGLLFRRNADGRPSRRLLEDKIGAASGLEIAKGRCDRAAEETETTVRGVIRLWEVPLLAHYGTAHGLYDYPTVGYDCALKSDAYRLGEYAGDYVEVTGALVDVGKELPVMNVTRLELLKMKWMR